MKSLIVKSIYTGIGLLDSGKKGVEHLGRELARQADLSEKDGQKIANQLRIRADKAITNVHSVVQSEIKKAVDTLHAATRADMRHVSARKKKTTSASHPHHKSRARKTSRRGS